MTPIEPDDRITLKASPRRVRALYQNHLIADSDDVIILYERGLEPVMYFNRADVSMEYMGKTDKLTTCPYKGQASHYSLLMEGVIAENAVWSYEDPIAGMEALRGRIAFYPGVVDIYELSGEDRDDPPLGAPRA